MGRGRGVLSLPRLPCFFEARNNSSEAADNNQAQKKLQTFNLECYDYDHFYNDYEQVGKQTRKRITLHVFVHMDNS